MISKSHSTENTKRHTWIPSKIFSRIPGPSSTESGCTHIGRTFVCYTKEGEQTIYQENSSHLQSRYCHLDLESAAEKDNHKFLCSICHHANKKAPHKRFLQNEYQKIHRKNDQDSHNSTLCVRRTGSLTVNPAVSSYTVPKPENNVQGYVHSERILSSLSAFWICCISYKITAQNTFSSITSVDGCWFCTCGTWNCWKGRAIELKKYVVGGTVQLPSIHPECKLESPLKKTTAVLPSSVQGNPHSTRRKGNSLQFT